MSEGNAFVLRLLSERRQRLVGAIMREAEQKMFPHVSPQIRKEFRTTVLEAVGSYHDVALDCMKASVDDGTRVNDPETILAAIRTEIRREMRHGA